MGKSKSSKSRKITSPWMTKHEAAMYANTHIEEINGAISSGKLPIYRRGKHDMLINEADLDTWIRNTYVCSNEPHHTKAKVVRWVMTNFLPTASAAYIGLAAVWGWPYTDQVSQTSAIICACIDTIVKSCAR